MKVVCYYPNWPYYRQGDGKYLVEDIDTSICTHIVYSFVVLDPSSHLIKIHDDWLDVQLGNLRKFTNLKAANPNVKFMLALGGWNDSRKPGVVNIDCFIAFFKLCIFRPLLHPAGLTVQALCLCVPRCYFPGGMGL